MVNPPTDYGIFEDDHVEVNDHVEVKLNSETFPDKTASQLATRSKFLSQFEMKVLFGFTFQTY